MFFNIKSWIKPWNAILTITPNCPRILFAPKKMKINVLFRFPLDGQLFINHLFQLFFGHCFLTWFICMPFIHHHFFYDKWSITSLSKPLKTCNFEDCSKLNLNFNNNFVSFFIQISFFFNLKHLASSPLQLHQLKISNFWILAWPLGTFARDNPFF